VYTWLASSKCLVLGLLTALCFGTTEIHPIIYLRKEDLETPARAKTQFDEVNGHSQLLTLKARHSGTYDTNKYEKYMHNPIE
jgi:hypothetical protein